MASPGRDLVLPVSNEPWSEEARGSPAFAYHTPALLEEAVRSIASRPGPTPAGRPRSPVYAVRREVLAELPDTLPLDEVPQEAERRGRRVFIDPGSYLHRYGDMDGQARADLVARIPAGAASVLDVGCSRGETARLLREAGVTRIVGIEPDAGDAADAAKLCDRVLTVPLEEVREEFPGQFDAVLFGDVLEHLVDPAAALARVRPWLSPRGVVVASVPNLGHWSVIGDLLEGRFDYVPVLDPFRNARAPLHAADSPRPLRGLGLQDRLDRDREFSASPAGAEKLQRLAPFPAPPTISPRPNSGATAASRALASREPPVT